jgi:16S rRNA (cytosine967-C5)-methyltransferase
VTPGARVQAAIEVLDRVFAGEAAERALTGWARGARFAGSKDRAAVRDHVFDALRRLRSAAWAGGLGERPLKSMTGRAVMAGLLLQRGDPIETAFTGERHAPDPWCEGVETGAPPPAVALDCQDWLLPRLRESLGQRAEPILYALRDRAPVVLRAHARQGRDAVQAALAAEGFECDAHPLSPTALVVTGPTRGLTRTRSFAEGAFEMQDAGSQALVDRLPDMRGARVLDLCAGGGGKALAIAARGAGEVLAHDADPSRMRDLPERAARAGARIAVVGDPEAKGLFDLVVADAPCSGSGSWRRAPEAKWRLTPERLAGLRATQSGILDRAAALVRPGGWLAYMTCSLLREENAAQADAAAARNGLRLATRWDCTPLDGADGFHLSLMRR